MSAVKSGSSLRALVLTPQRTPRFIIPSRSPLHFLSPQRSPDHCRLLSDPDEESPSPHLLLRLPQARNPRPPAEAADTDLTTRAAMSLPHVEKLTTPYGFRAVLAASPCTRRRESLFHRRIQERESPLQEEAPGPLAPPAHPGSGSRIRALGLTLMKELRRPAAMLRALSPRRRT